jgi:lipoprotein LprG
MTSRSISRRPNGPVLFAELSLVAAATALVGVLAYAFAADPPAASDVAADEAASEHGEVVDLDDGAVADPDADVSQVVADAAAAMADVASVEFRLDRSGAPIFIDEFESLALDSLIGQFTIPTRARSQLTVTVDGNLTTEIGAIAIDGEVWISNPVTGDFENLSPGFDIDPSHFFDPEGGWQPLLANLRDVELVGVDDRGGDRYHVRGVAPAAEVQNITVGLVRDQDVPVELWIHPGTSLVTRAEFATAIDGAESLWVLELDRYGESFTIRPPVNVRSVGDS